jgi:enoyl-[acyl-carrier protein] reductase I
MIVDLKHKQGLVTGIANGHSIAYGCAEKFREADAELVTTFLDAKTESFMRPLAVKLNSSLILPCDVQKEEEIIALFAAIQKQWGKLDFMLHSMAFAPKTDLNAKLIDCSKDGFLEAMDISCHSLIRLAKYAAPLMKDGGSIVTMTYYGSQKVILNYNLMGVVKAALESSVRYLAYELGPQNIRVNAISPGPIQTRAASGIPNFYEYIDAHETRSPLHRLVDISNVGNLAAFLVSDAAKNMTGQVYFVDSGYSIIG